jgi:tRNA threonylcarbamoyladenosine modification (KEOPS) complex  Pcc1 subunit
MAQVTYRGVKYDTNDNKQAKSQMVKLTYRGVKSEKELTAA